MSKELSQALNVRPLKKVYQTSIIQMKNGLHM